MASSHVLFSAIVLLFVLATATATATATANLNCEPGWGVPHNPLQRCHAYVVSKTCGVGPRLPLLVMKERCCRELADIVGYCRCEALRTFMDGVVTAQGVFEGKLLHDMPGCPRSMQRGFATTLVAPEECNLLTIHGGPYCPSLNNRDVVA